MIEQLRRMYAHMEWADRRTLASLMEARPAPEDALELFAHVLGTEHRWFSRLTGTAPKVAVWPEATLGECERLLEANTTDYRGFLAGLRAEDLERTVRYINSAGDEFVSTAEDILLHVVLHGMYHRGQVALTLRRQGLGPSPTDYIAFRRGAPAATRRDSSNA